MATLLGPTVEFTLQDCADSSLDRETILELDVLDEKCQSSWAPPIEEDD
jgi:hypothetical protein